MANSTGERHFLRRVLLFSLVGACFISLVSVGVTVALAFSGLFSLPSFGEVEWMLPVIFAASFVLVMVGVMYWEQFLGRGGLR